MENDSGLLQEDNDGGRPKMKNGSDGLLKNELQTSG